MSHQKQILIFTIFTLFTFGCSKTETVAPESSSQNAQPEQTSEPIDVQIHDYTQQVGEDYTAQFGIEKGEALAAIAASKKFNMTILDVSRAHDLIEDKKAGWNISPVELDQTNIKRFRDIGFFEKDGNWYFEGQIVNMGKPLSP